MKPPFDTMRNFQTPDYVCELMVSLLDCPAGSRVLEPTPGQGNLVSELEKKKFDVIAPPNFDMLPSGSRFDAICANPPFTPMALGYDIMEKCMNMTDHMVMLLPWFLIINSARRFQYMLDFGMVSIHNLPRSVFPNSRIQCFVGKFKRFSGPPVIYNYKKPEIFYAGNYEVSKVN